VQDKPQCLEAGNNADQHHDEAVKPTAGITAADAAGATVLQLGQGQHAGKPRQSRLYFIDWLRVFMTVMVVVIHCFNTLYPRGHDTYW
jgi:hypothetical protein